MVYYIVNTNKDKYLIKMAFFLGSLIQASSGLYILISECELDVDDAYAACGASFESDLLDLFNTFDGDTTLEDACQLVNSKFYLKNVCFYGQYYI